MPNSKTSISKSSMIAKSLNQELMQVTYVAMQAGVDAHLDYVDAEEIRKAKESFNKALHNSKKLANLFHLGSTDAFDIIESYIAPCEMLLNKNAVPEGSWLVTLQINKGYEALWEGIKSGDFVGVSIGATAKVQDLE